MEKEFIRMNVELPGYPQGQQWLKDEAPDAVKWWFDNKSILFETTICSVVKIKVVKDKDVENDNSRKEILFRKFDIPKTKKPKESGKIVKKAKKKVVKKARKSKKKTTSKKQYNSKAPMCKGINGDGSPCKTTKLVKDGYCRHHINQADQNN